MKFIKLILLALVVSVLPGCSSDEQEKFLKIGDISTSGFLSQTLTEFNYYPITGSDQNRTGFEISFDLCSSADKTMPLDTYGYKAVFDENPNLGGLASNYGNKRPSSIAPNETVSITLSLTCFKDWETVMISYSDSNNSFFSFKLRSEDFEYPVNNSFPALKAGDMAKTKNGEIGVKLISLTRSTYSIRSNYINVNTYFSVINYTNENINMGKFEFVFDGGFSKGYISVSSQTQPSIAYAKSDNRFTITLEIQTYDWKVCVVKCTFSNSNVLKFNLNHGDFNYE